MAKKGKIHEMVKAHLERVYDAFIHKNLTDLIKSDEDITLTIKMHGPLLQLSSGMTDNHCKNALICSLALASVLSAIVDDFRAEDTVTDSDVAGWRDITIAAYRREISRILEIGVKPDGANQMHIKIEHEEDDDDAAD